MLKISRDADSKARLAFNMPECGNSRVYFCFDLSAHFLRRDNPNNWNLCTCNCYIHPCLTLFVLENLFPASANALMTYIDKYLEITRWVFGHEPQISSRDIHHGKSDCVVSSNTGHFTES